ncbi:MAG: poly-beta-hydroxybutyrate polymerase N-terminal domain-containing protein, partial [Alphaproteobacteria bacterium]
MMQGSRRSDSSLPRNKAIESKKLDSSDTGTRGTASDELKSGFPKETVQPSEFAGWPWQFNQFFPGMSDFMTAFAARREAPPATPTTRAPGASEPIEPPPSVDRLVQTALGKTTFSISPVSLALAYFD